ncbi:MAG TPA: SUMF1/EgtB/PvdO family nonheme iron enzyme, partial [Candidatus Obscuribacterales bacterium]
MLLRLHHLNNLAAIAGAAWLAIFIAVISTLCPVAANDVPPSAAVRARSGERDMVWIPGGSFKMGCADESFGDTRPIHEVHLSGFWLDRTPVTNEQFAEFVAATGYVTAAERKPDPKDFPGAPPEDLVPGSLVFSPPPKPVSLNHPHQWWRYVPGASWKHPQGPASSIQDKLRHPVVHVAFEDAVAYAKWAGKRLP